ncbi:coiled-coil-helix-coiled-coil-helix domain containing 6b isoform X2 [Pangasianodon hypophthalmus]|uniref:coiled-coil-helix-coiled-coil-helix domain containing 6b isoform X2 n=1 Tax=Pangasianodon hypophthalmus TaxID=310915 RepID=UPI002306F97E|nr:coiled-coil-helix-coiled-coil-helix domain containing 6b isoform X2 [Pangasianodon hypophthalmus]
MGGTESTGRKVSFGLNEDDNVTVLQGIKLSEDVRQRMREASQSPQKPQSPKPESRKPEPAPGGHSSAEMPEELRKRFELEQALLREELARITRREKESVGDDVNPAVLQERARTKEEQKNVQNLPAELNAWVQLHSYFHYSPCRMAVPPKCAEHVVYFCIGADLRSVSLVHTAYSMSPQINCDHNMSANIPPITLQKFYSSPARPQTWPSSLFHTTFVLPVELSKYWWGSCINFKSGLSDIAEHCSKSCGVKGARRNLR